MGKYYDVNEFYLDTVLSLTDYAIWGSKIAGDFVDYLKLMVEKHFSNGIKIEVVILIIYSYGGEEDSNTYVVRENSFSLNLQIFYQ